MRRYCFLFALLFAFVNCVFAINVIFRYDDFKLIDDSIQNSLVELFAVEKVPLHIAVIPFNKDSSMCLEKCEAVERVKELQKRGILQIAMHGYCHKGDTFNGEFLGLTYDEQLFRLQHSSSVLDSIFETHVHIFIPPWNRYNHITLDILHELGYDIVSSELASNQIVSDTRFQYYPEGVDHPAKLPKVVRSNSRRAGLIVCMFHRYDFSDTFTIEDLRGVIRDIQSDSINRITTMNALFGSTTDFNERRIDANLVHPLLSKILYTRHVILTTTEINKVRYYDLIIHLIIVLMISLWGALILHGKKLTAYGITQTTVLVYAGLQTWFQFVMPKVGLFIIVLLPVIVVLIFNKK